MVVVVGCLLLLLLLSGWVAIVVGRGVGSVDLDLRCWMRVGPVVLIKADLTGYG